MIGIDIVHIPRIESIIERKPGWVGRFFTEEEVKLFESRKFHPRVIAANFAAKEAFSKALGTGVSGFALKDISVLRKESGQPYIQLSEELGKKTPYRIHVSISHDGDYAAAFVLLEKL